MIDQTYLDEAVRESLFELVEGDRESLAELVDTILECNPLLLDQLKSGIATQDGEQIRDAAHSLKSSNAQLGATHFSVVCQEMENYGRSQQAEQARQLLPDLIAEYERAEQAFTAWMNELS